MYRVYFYYEGFSENFNIDEKKHSELINALRYGDKYFEITQSTWVNLEKPYALNIYKEEKN